MDGNGSYPRVVCPPDQGALVPLPRIVVNSGPFDDEAQDDYVDLLQQAIAVLCQFVAWLMAALQALRLQVIDWRCQANYWRAQHQRARGREDDLKENVQLLQGETRELKRRLFSSKSETSSSTQPTTGTTAPPFKKRRPRGQSRRAGTKAMGDATTIICRPAMNPVRCPPTKPVAPAAALRTRKSPARPMATSSRSRFTPIGGVSRRTAPVPPTGFLRCNFRHPDQK